MKISAHQLYGDKLNRIILYGSYARGDNSEESDIDIMIVLNCDVEEIKKLRGLTAEMASDISLEHEVFLSVLLRDKKHYVKTGVFGKEYSKIITEAFQIRSDSDYDDYYIISKEEVEEQIQHATYFLNGIKKYVDNLYKIG